MKKFQTDAEINKYLFANLKKSLVLILDILPYLNHTGAPGAKQRYRMAHKYVEKMANQFAKNK